jgi:tRNA pseudouridine55 synthase
VTGILVVEKPVGPTSHDVVNSLRRLTGEKKAGHTGTLDPMASGVLVVCFGAATKALPYLAEGSKKYQVEAILGVATDTQDSTGRITAERADTRISWQDLQEALQSSEGESQQIPPMFSAVQIGGVRLYQLAREGREVERPARRIRLDELVLSWPAASERPVFLHGDRFGFTITGSRGLYVRTLCHDLGTRLGCGAHMAALRRLASGPFVLDEAVPLEGLTREAVAPRLIPLGKALGHLPAVSIDERTAERVSHGNAIAAEIVTQSLLARAEDPSGRTLAILERRGDLWQPVRVFQE